MVSDGDFPIEEFKIGERQIRIVRIVMNVIGLETQDSSQESKNQFARLQFAVGRFRKVAGCHQSFDFSKSLKNARPRIHSGQVVFGRHPKHSVVILQDGKRDVRRQPIECRERFERCRKSIFVELNGLVDATPECDQVHFPFSGNANAVDVIAVQTLQNAWHPTTLVVDDVVRRREME